MKVRPIAAAAALVIAAILPQLGSSQRGAPSRLYVRSSTQSTRVALSADQILREDSGNLRPSPYASVIHLRGNVEIRICCVQLPTGNDASKQDPEPPSMYLLMHADDADYHEETGEIEAHGAVRVTYQNPK
jgi:lipopolysaccharide assembly outer membrane protein LptD (OstA)